MSAPKLSEMLAHLEILFSKCRQSKMKGGRENPAVGQITFWAITVEHVAPTPRFQPISPQITSSLLLYGHWPPSQQFSQNLFSNHLRQGQKYSHGNFFPGRDPEGECYVVPLLPAQPASLPASRLRLAAGCSFSSMGSRLWFLPIIVSSFGLFPHPSPLPIPSSCACRCAMQSTSDSTSPSHFAPALSPATPALPQPSPPTATHWGWQRTRPAGRCWRWQRPARRSSRSGRATRTGIGASSLCRTSGQAKRTTWSYAPAQTLASWVKPLKTLSLTLITLACRGSPGTDGGSLRQGARHSGLWHALSLAWKRSTQAKEGQDVVGAGGARRGHSHFPRCAAAPLGHSSQPVNYNIRANNTLWPRGRYIFKNSSPKVIWIKVQVIFICLLMTGIHV